MVLLTATDTYGIVYRIKESLRKTFANLANDFEQRLRTVSSDLTMIEGPLEVCIWLSELLPDTNDPRIGTTISSSGDTNANTCTLRGIGHCCSSRG